MEVIYDSQFVKPDHLPLVSIILLDWSCRESFHSLHYLNQQTVPRSQYEILWIEYYQRKAAPIENQLNEAKQQGRPPVVDQWIALGMSSNVYYHKHLMYNIGIIRSRGEIVVICDSDAVFTPTFVETIIQSFRQNPKIALHLDEARNINRQYYPFCYPTVEQLLGDDCINWKEGATTGLRDTVDPLHSRNYGSCMAARRADLIQIGGADEHLDYLGHICGPYELTFRLVNYGREEVWHDREFLYHAWHPGTDGNNNLIGPHDGRSISTTALEAVKSKRILPLIENQAIQALRKRKQIGENELLGKLIDPSYAERFSFEMIARLKKIKPWHKHELLGAYKNFNIIKFKEGIYGVPQALGPINLSEEEENCHPTILAAETKGEVQKEIDRFNLTWLTPQLICEYKGCNIIRYGLKMYGIPQILGSINFTKAVERRLVNHLSDFDETKIKQRIDKFDLSSFLRHSLGFYRGYHLIQFRGRVFGIPEELGEVELTQDQDRLPQTILIHDTKEDVKLLIDLKYEMMEWEPSEGQSQEIHMKYKIPQLICSYKHYNIVAYGQQFYGIHQALGPLDLTHEQDLNIHGIFSAPTVDRVKKLIDFGIFLPHEQPLSCGTFEGYQLIQFSAYYYAIPKRLRGLDFHRIKQRCSDEILSDVELSRLKEKILKTKNTQRVEFAGWLPRYRDFGNCGTHPQFIHTTESPEGYRFICSKQNLNLIYHWRHKKMLLSWRGLFVAWAAFCLSVKSFLNGAKLIHIQKFLKTRSLPSQLLLPLNRKLIFLPSVPFTVGHQPWVIEVEDTISLFFPFLHNGETVKFDPKEFPYFPIYKALIESRQCRGIITHIHSTAENLPKLFQNKKLSKKITYAPLGIPLVPFSKRPEKKKGELTLLFNNSFHQDPSSFYCRGGLDVLKAFYILRKIYPDLKLVFRSVLPEDVDPLYRNIIRSPGIQHIEHFLEKEKWEALLREADIYVLPSARIHVVSLLQAMAYGIAIVTSDGWAIEEYVQDGRNGLIVKGRYGKTTYIEEETGILRENYEITHSSDPVVVDGVVKTVTKLIEQPSLREQLVQNARHDVETKYNLDRWNQGLKQAFDQALGKRSIK